MKWYHISNYSFYPFLFKIHVMGIMNAKTVVLYLKCHKLLIIAPGKAMIISWLDILVQIMNCTVMLALRHSQAGEAELNVSLPML